MAEARAARAYSGHQQGGVSGAKLLPAHVLVSGAIAYCGADHLSLVGPAACLALLHPGHDEARVQRHVKDVLVERALAQEEEPRVGTSSREGLVVGEPFCDDEV